MANRKRRNIFFILNTTTCLTNTDNGFDYNSIRRLLQLAKITEEQCKKCWAFTLCISCLLNCDGKHRLSQSKRLSKCKEVKSLAEYKLRKYVMYNNIISETSRLSFMEV